MPMAASSPATRSCSGSAATTRARSTHAARHDLSACAGASRRRRRVLVRCNPSPRIGYVLFARREVALTGAPRRPASPRRAAAVGRGRRLTYPARSPCGTTERETVPLLPERTSTRPRWLRIAKPARCTAQALAGDVMAAAHSRARNTLPSRSGCDSRAFVDSPRKTTASGSSLSATRRRHRRLRPP